MSFRNGHMRHECISIPQRILIVFSPVVALIVGAVLGYLIGAY